MNMRYMKHIVLSFCLSGCTFFLSGQNTPMEKVEDMGEEYHDPYQDALQTIRSAVHPVYKFNNVMRFAIQQGEISDRKVEAVRIVFSGVPLAKAVDAAKASPQLKKTEYGDIVMIPVNTGFRLDKALALSNVVKKKETADFFYSQYGLEWRKLETGLQRYTLYLGKNENYYFFGTCNLPILVILQNKLNLKGGFVAEKYLAAALSIQDTFFYTAEAASRLLPAFGDAGLPYLRESIRKIGSLDEGAYPHFRVLSAIGSDKSFEMMNSYAAAHDMKTILLPLFDSIVSAKLVDKRLLPSYRSMLHHQVAIPFVADVLLQLKLKKEAVEELQEIIEKPTSYESYRQALRTLCYWENGNKATIHDERESEIRLLLIRSGDTPNTTAFRNVEESESERELRLGKEDAARIKEAYDALLAAPQKKMAMLCGINLAMTDFSKRSVTRSYVSRVQNVGVRLLRDLPSAERAELSRLLRILVIVTSDKKESDRFRDLALRVGAL